MSKHAVYNKLFVIRKYIIVTNMSRVFTSTKNIKIPTRCIARRQYNTESASTTSTETRNNEKMSVVASLTSTQLKAFGKYFTKTIRELNTYYNKQWIRMIQQYPSKYQQQNDSDSSQPGMQSDSSSLLNSNLGIPQVLNSYLRFNFSTSKQNQQISNEQKISLWKKQTPALSKEVVASRTRQVLLNLAAAESAGSRLKRLEDFIDHLMQYPQAKDLAVKSKAVTTLLKLRHQVSDQDTQSVLREVLALLGHVEPLPAKGIRILSMDGGGTRGVLVIEQLRMLERLTGRRVCEMFDYICGVSTGAIMSMLFGPHKRNLQDCSMLYKELSSQIFSQSAIWGTGNLLWSHSYYDTALWENILKTYIGNVQLIKTSRDPECPKVAAVSAVVNQAGVKPFVFRNYELPSGIPGLYSGSSRAELWQAVRASAAAPSYFEEFRLADFLHQDGGILVNNPTAIAIHEAKLLWPNEALQCVVSFGTGRKHLVSNNLEQNEATNGDSYSSWKTKFSKILESATDTEAVHSTLHDLLPENVYFRFNPYLNEVSHMAEIRSDKLEQLEQDAIMYSRRNEDKFQQVAAVLTQPRSHLQRAQDWFKLKRTLLHAK